MQRTRPLFLVLLVFSLAIALQCAVAQVSIATVPAGTNPFGVAVNSITNKGYVANITCDINNLPCPSAGTVTVIDGATNNITTVNVGVYPAAVAVNPTTNKIYIANNCGNDVNCASLGTVTIIDGVTNSTSTVNVGDYPYALAVNSATNKIYVSNDCGNDHTCSSPGTVTVIDGVTNNTTDGQCGKFSRRCGGQLNDQPDLRGKSLRQRQRLRQYWDRDGHQRRATIPPDSYVGDFSPTSQQSTLRLIRSM